MSKSVKKSRADKKAEREAAKAAAKAAKLAEKEAARVERESRKKKKKPDYTFKSYPHLLEIKPKEKYIFHSDYFAVDGGFGCVLSFFHIEGSNDNFGPFWGIGKIPGGLEDGVTTICFEQVRRMTEGWLHEHQNRTEGIAQMNEDEQHRAGSNTNKGKADRVSKDLVVIASELQDGASYLHVHYRLLVKAPTLDALDRTIAQIDRMYVDRFATLSASPYHGEQRSELSKLFAKNGRKKGKGFYFTSTEFAGSYSLVTHGLEDPTGEYVGYMVGDVNNSAVLFDVNDYSNHVVIANESYNERLGRVRVVDMWGSKISQSCLLNNGRVVHIILNGADLNKIGPKFKNITSRIDMSHGDVNMFEMFGDANDELLIFPMQMKKLTLMAEQLCNTSDADRALIHGSLEDIATRFYIDNRMWHENAVENRDKLRVVGIPHEQVPRLQMFVSYLETRYKSLVAQSNRDNELLHAVNVLRITFKSLLSNNGDLFNTTTKDAIDKAKDCRRIIYDFSKLIQRGNGIAMAQLVNIIGFAVGNLGRGDTVVIHGAEYIDESIKDFINSQFDMLHDRGGRVAFLYNNIDKMLQDKSFNQFDKADYTIFGNMTETAITDYQKLLGQDIPADLARLIANKSDNVCYIRRGFDNVVFRLDLALGIKKKRRGGVV